MTAPFTTTALVRSISLGWAALAVIACGKSLAGDQYTYQAQRSLQGSAKTFF